MFVGIEALAKGGTTAEPRPSLSDLNSLPLNYLQGLWQYVIPCSLTMHASVPAKALFWLPLTTKTTIFVGYL